MHVRDIDNILSVGAFELYKKRIHNTIAHNLLECTMIARYHSKYIKIESYHDDPYCCGEVCIGLGYNLVCNQSQNMR